jgi:hypothetical protein
VSVSNNLTWLVPYHYDNGRQARAMTLAQMAGNTYSVTGQTTQADLLDRMGRHYDAEALYRITTIYVMRATASSHHNRDMMFICRERLCSWKTTP